MDMADILIAWYPVRLNGGTYSNMFSINETGLQWGTSDTSSFGGWVGTSHTFPRTPIPIISYTSDMPPKTDPAMFSIACTWSHGVPQLFWKVDYVSYPSPVCAQVELHPEYDVSED